jgi:hypothetical protein
MSAMKKKRSQQSSLESMRQRRISDDDAWLDLDERHLFDDDRLFALAAHLVDDGSLTEAALSELCLFASASRSALPPSAPTSWFSSVLQRLPNLADQRAVFTREFSFGVMCTRAAHVATRATVLTLTRVYYLHRPICSALSAL